MIVLNFNSNTFRYKDAALDAQCNGLISFQINLATLSSSSLFDQVSNTECIDSSNIVLDDCQLKNYVAIFSFLKAYKGQVDQCSWDVFTESAMHMTIGCISYVLTTGGSLHECLSTAQQNYADSKEDCMDDELIMSLDFSRSIPAETNDAPQINNISCELVETTDCPLFVQIQFNEI